MIKFTLVAVLILEEGFFHSEETKRKIGQKSKEKFIKNPALKQHLINLHKGKEPWNKGKKGIYSKKTIEKMSQAMKNRINGNTHKVLSTGDAG